MYVRIFLIINRRYRLFFGVIYVPSSVNVISITRPFLAIPFMRLKRISSNSRNDDTIIQTRPDSVIIKCGIHLDHTTNTRLLITVHK